MRNVLSLRLLFALTVSSTLALANHSLQAEGYFCAWPPAMFQFGDVCYYYSPHCDPGSGYVPIALAGTCDPGPNNECANAATSAFCVSDGMGQTIPLAFGAPRHLHKLEPGTKVKFTKNKLLEVAFDEEPKDGFPVARFRAKDGALIYVELRSFKVTARPYGKELLTTKHKIGYQIDEMRLDESRKKSMNHMNDDRVILSARQPYMALIAWEDDKIAIVTAQKVN